MGKKLGWLIGKLITAACLIGTELFLYLLANTKLFPGKYLLIGGIALFLMSVLIGALTWNTRSKGRYGFGLVLAALFLGILGAGGKYVTETMSAAGNMTSANTEVTEMAVYVRADDTNDYDAVAATYNYGILAGLDRENSDEVVADINKELGTEIQTTVCQNLPELADALLNQEVDAIILNRGFVDVVAEMEGYENFPSQIREAALRYVHRDLTIEGTGTDNSQTTLERTFSVYISGVDNRGALTAKARSDVNIIATVNLDTHQVLLLTTPRDYYVPLSISNGEPDKLTHAGIYGINCSIDTLEMLYDTDIDYYFRVNFQGFKDMIDALGGITVTSPIDFTNDVVDEYQAEYHFVKGENQLNGDQALVFARERHAFADGDNQRGRNQMEVIRAVLEKAMSPEILAHYTDLLKAMEGSFETSMSYDQIASLVREQLNSGAKWEILSYAVEGEGASRVPYSMNQKAYVTIPDEETVNTAKQMLKSMRDGEVISLPE